MARTVETHYDNLRVLRDAPVDVIKASYRLLAQRCHPDRTPEPDAMLKMQLINKAWDVLSAPERRAMHMYRNGREAERMFAHGGRRFVLDNMVFGTYTIKYKIVADGKARVFQARQVFPLIQTPAEARDKRYNKFNKIRVTTFNLADSHADAAEIALDQF